jgi:murein DD-endopeptidase MepM/ murein hydrolase activator NlpD
MKKFNFINKSVSVLIVLFGLNLLIYIGSSMTSNAKAEPIELSAKNNAIAYENHVLRSNYQVLVNRISEIEGQLITVNDIDNHIYSQIMGLNIDSSEFEIEKQNFVFDSLGVDSLFKNLDERTLLASKIVANQLNKLVESSDLLKKNKNVMNLYPSISPVKSNDFIEISSGFGWRKHPVYGTPLFHDGIDISTEVKSNVFATMSGKVIEITRSKTGYGNRIVIENSGGFETLYAHLSGKFYVREGQLVMKGQLIATTGNSGLSTGPHLHYEIRKFGQLKDPLGYIYTYMTNNQQLIASK